MSATLTWNHSGVFTKSSTGATAALIFTDLNSMFTAKAADTNFRWEVASANTGSNPYYIVLKRKSGEVGRILIASWTTGLTYNTKLFDQVPQADCTWITFFPNSSTDTPAAGSLLPVTTSAPTILGDDTGVLKVAPGVQNSNLYSTALGTLQFSYMDSEEGIVIGSQSAGTGGSASSLFLLGAGYLVVDSVDVTYPCNIGTHLGTSFATGWGPWTSNSLVSGNISSITGAIRANYNGNNKSYFQAFSPTNSWSGAAATSSVLVNTATSNVWFVPVTLIGQTKGEGIPLKLRQIAIGPITSSAFEVYSTVAGVQALQFNSNPTGNNSCPWFTNFKV